MLFGLIEKDRTEDFKPRNPAGNYLNGCNLITARVMKIIGNCKMLIQFLPRIVYFSFLEHL